MLSTIQQERTILSYVCKQTRTLYSSTRIMVHSDDHITPGSSRGGGRVEGPSVPEQPSSPPSPKDPPD